MAKKLFLDIIEKAQNGGMDYGLCYLVERHPGAAFKGDILSTTPHMRSCVGILNYFRPTPEDKKVLQGKNKSTVYWGSDDNLINSGVLTDLRITVLLFCAAMNGEL